MMSLIYLASALALGAAVTKRLGLRLFGIEGPAIAVVLGLVLWTWLSFVCALVLPYGLSLPLTVILAGLVSWLLWRNSPPWKHQALPGGILAWRGWAIFTAVTLIIIGGLMWSHYLLPGPGGLTSANSTWADFGLHASLISHFVAGDRFPIDFPIAAGTRLTYPFMVDLLSAWYVYGGWSLHLALFVPSVLLIGAFLQLMLAFSLRLFGRIGGAIIGLALALLGGSAVGAFTAAADWRASGLQLSEFLAHLPKDYTTLGVPNAQVSNLLGDILLPQRAFLMGFAVFAVTMILFLHVRTSPNRRLAIFAGGLIGLLPLVHAHTFVMLAAVTASLWLESYLRHRRIMSQWFFVGVSALALAIPQIAWQNVANGNGTGGHLSLGWTIQPGEHLLTFLVQNYGLMGVMIVGLSGLLILRRPLRRYLAWYAPFVVVFIFANIYSLQPFAYDNLKLMLYTFLMTSLFAGYGAIWLVHRHKTALVPVALAAVLLSSSGVLGVAREYQHVDEFASNDDIALSNWIKAATPATAIFVATDRPNQPVATLAGRTIVAGYRGWLYNYHLNYTPRLTAIQSALNGELGADNPYHAEYLAVGSYESSEWTINRTALDARYTRLYSNPSWDVYRLSR